MHAQTTMSDAEDSASAQTSISSDNAWSVAVDSIGTSGIALVSALKNALKISQQEIARRLLHAPSLLAENLSSESAQQIADYLSEVGLEARAIGPDETLEQGVGGYELAIVDMDFSRLSELLKLVVELTGVAPDKAITLLNKFPAIVLANISENNAVVLQKRFTQAGAQVAISCVEESHYDVLLASANFAAQRELMQLVKTLRLPNTQDQANSDAIALQNLNYEQAQQLWSAAQERRIDCKLLNRDYQRYDVRLETVDREQKQAAANCLIEKCSIPSNIVDKVLQRLPIGIANGQTLQQACELVEMLHGCGASAVADLTATLSFDLEIDNLSRPDKVEQLLIMIGGLSKTHFSRLLKGKSKRVDGPLNYQQARWLQYELSKFGCKVSLQKRG